VRLLFVEEHANEQAGWTAVRQFTELQQAHCRMVGGDGDFRQACCYHRRLLQAAGPRRQWEQNPPVKGRGLVDRFAQTRKQMVVEPPGSDK